MMLRREILRKFLESGEVDSRINSETYSILMFTSLLEDENTENNISDIYNILSDLRDWFKSVIVERSTAPFLRDKMDDYELFPPILSASLLFDEKDPSCFQLSADTSKSEFEDALVDVLLALNDPMFHNLNEIDYPMENDDPDDDQLEYLDEDLSEIDEQSSSSDSPEEYEPIAPPPPPVPTEKPEIIAAKKKLQELGETGGNVCANCIVDVENANSSEFQIVAKLFAEGEGNQLLMSPQSRIDSNYQNWARKLKGNANEKPSKEEFQNALIHVDLSTAAQFCQQMRSARAVSLCRLTSHLKLTAIPNTRQFLFEHNNRIVSAMKLRNSENIVDFSESLWERIQANHNGKFLKLSLSGELYHASIKALGMISVTPITQLMENVNWDNAENFDLGDLQLALSNHKRFNVTALKYLQIKCIICNGELPCHKTTLFHRPNQFVCSCLVCLECYDDVILPVISKPIPAGQWKCPCCHEPKENDDGKSCLLFDQWKHRVNFWKLNHLQAEAVETFTFKVAQHELKKQANSAECPNCFKVDVSAANKVNCSKCKTVYCKVCKLSWLAKHDGKTCEQMEQLRREEQLGDLAQKLGRCPKCGEPVEVVMGGCQHLDCTNPSCGSQFCECGVFFYQGEKCSPQCKELGFHAHHPRNCFADVRNLLIDNVELLLKKHKIQYQVQPVGNACSVKVGLDGKDCTKHVMKFGFCQDHLKFHLWTFVRDHKLDPIEVMNTQELQASYRSGKIAIPPSPAGATEAQIEEMLRNDLKKRWPLGHLKPPVQ